jgi:hypothetical protein
MGSWNLSPGLNFVGSFQVSGQPYATGSIDCLEASLPGGVEVVFPYVTRWFKVLNNDELNACKVAFSVSGMTGSSNYFTVAAADLDQFGQGNSGVLELKVSSIWISGSNNVDIIAGLTNINTNKTATETGPNWSGSTGVG